MSEEEKYSTIISGKKKKFYNCCTKDLTFKEDFKLLPHTFLRFVGGGGKAEDDCSHL